MNFNLPPRIYFTGFMATGKSRLAELTSVALGWRFIDTDALIEKQYGATISEIFEKEGETKFRELEREAVEKAGEEEQAVIALGGGTLKNPAVLERVKNSGVLVGLWATPETIFTRVNRKNSRPLLSGLSDEEKMEKIKSLLAERRKLYEQAHFQVESTENVPHHVLTKRIIQRIQVESLAPLEVSLGERSYPIYIHKDLSGHAGAIVEKAKCPPAFVVITDDQLKAHQRDFIKALTRSLGRSKLFFFRSGETEKNLGSINRLFTYLIKHHYDRNTTLVALGGGVVGDMTGFAAATYLRGVPYIQIPTTLLSMVDSSVGGKTGVNHRLGKNLIGAFHQPRAVIISSDVLKTLPESEYRAGLAEVAKYAVIWDAKFFDYLWENADKILAKEPEILHQVIRTCCAIKAEVVRRDEREGGLRAILNFGHTFGHALETSSRYAQISHGYAVALGMRVASRLAVLTRRISPDVEEKINGLLDRLSLPKAHNLTAREELWEIMGRDKKVSGGKRMYILPTAIGAVEKTDAPGKDLVDKAWEAIEAGDPQTTSL